MLTIDFEKAFDSPDHEFSLKVLHTFNFEPSVLWITLTKVLKKQNKIRAARVILNADKDNSVKLFSRLGWLPFYDEAKINKCPVGDCPQYMKSLFTRNSDIHHRRSRFGEWNLVCKRFNRETEGGRTF